jgi:hypothetical protein
MTEQRKLATSIDDLVRSFRDAICALIPIAERVHMHWKEPDAYDDWDQICESIYRSIVISSIEHAEGVGAFLPITAYDRRISSYKKNSFVCNSLSMERSAFICFETKVSPFDHSLFALLDSNFEVVKYSRLSTEQVKFIFCSQHRETGNLDFYDRVNVQL